MAIKLKKLTAAEQSSIDKLARSRTAPAREVERARMILLADRGKRVPAIAQELDLTATTVRTWLKRFNEARLDGLQDRPRAGRPVTYSPEQVAEVIATALTNPRNSTNPLRVGHSIGWPPISTRRNRWRSSVVGLMKC